MGLHSLRKPARFRRRGQRLGGRTILTQAGKVRLAAWQVECRPCRRRFVPVLELLGVARHARRSAGVAEMAAALATEAACTKAAGLLAELGRYRPVRPVGAP